MGIARRDAAIVLAAGVAAAAAHAAAPLRSAFDLHVPAPPIPVTVAGMPRLVYELHLTNFAREALTLVRVEVLDAQSGAAVAELRGEALDGRLGRPDLPSAEESRRAIGPGRRAVLYLELAPQKGAMPDTLSHRVEYEAAGTAKGVVEGARVRVQRGPLPVLGPPLAGGPWASVYDPSWERGHRRVLYAVDGRVSIPGRYAIDWIRLDANGRAFRGDSDRTADWLGYGAEVLAVADAVVAATRDDVAESERLSTAPPPPLQDATGNYVVLELADGRHAFYEHLKPGSIRVAPRERVRRGQPIAALGFTGQSTGPHLHFHVADLDSPLGAEGAPWGLERFKLLGRIASSDGLGREPWAPLDGAIEPERHAELPGPMAVVEFPEASPAGAARSGLARGEEAVKRATGACLQGDVSRALRLLDEIPPQDLSAPDQAFRDCLRERFGEAPPGSAPGSATAAERILAAFRSYWWSSLRGPEQRDAFEQRLVSELRALVGADGGAGWDALEPLIRRSLEEEGVHALLGRTGVLRELMLWRHEEHRNYPVSLPEAEHSTPVVVLDGFLGLGWGDYATCGRRGAGGWVRDGTLYAVRPRYESLEGEEFLVTFLGHETQHLADMKRFPGLEPWELEYRAKLVELAEADRTMPRIVTKFTEDQGDDPASPHSYANRRVLRALCGRLGLTDPMDLLLAGRPARRAAAVALLRDDSRSRSPAPPR